MSYYATLGVDENATQDEIKKAYRKLSKQFHPDVNPNGAEKFKDIADAYDTLGNEQKKAQYDAYSSNQRFSNSGFYGREDLSDMFDQVFSNAFGGQSRQRGYDFRVDMHISFGEAYTGTSKTFDLDGGRVSVDFKPGLLNGQKFKLKGKGAPHKLNSSLPNGDLIVTVHVIPQADFILNGNDIWVEKSIPWWDIMLGCEISILTPEGYINIKVPKGSYPGKTLRIKEKGFPIYDTKNKGAILCRLNATYPELNEEQLEYIHKIKNT